MVVVTDGHTFDGYKEPCEAIRNAVSEARGMEIKIFGVAITPDHMVMWRPRVVFNGVHCMNCMSEMPVVSHCLSSK